MKLRLLCATLLLTLCTGCFSSGTEPPPSGSPGSGISPATTPGAEISRVPADTSEEYVIRDGISLFDVGGGSWLGDVRFQDIVGVFDGKVIYMTNNRQLELWPTLYHYWLMDIENGQGEYIVDTPSEFLSSDSRVYMDGKLYSCPARVNEDGSLTNYFTLIDIDKRSTSVLSEMNLRNPSVYLSKLSGTEFVMLTHEEYGEAGVLSVVQIYNINTEAFTPLLKVTLESGDVQSEGQMVEQICAIDGKIIMVMSKQHGGENRRFFQTYAPSGALLSEIYSQDLNDFLYISQTRDMFVLGDYVLLSSEIKAGSALFYLTDGELTRVDAGEDDILPLRGYENVTDSLSVPQFCFLSRNEWRDAVLPSCLYAFDTGTGEIKKWLVDLDADCTRLCDGYSGPDGNVILHMERTDPDMPPMHRYYLIDAPPTSH